MPTDYRDVVLAHYEKKKDEGSLSPNLINPTPGSLRSECLIVCIKRYDPKDDEILSLFFSDGDSEKGYYKIIENTRAIKFKQLPKILNGTITNPGIKFIELIAWLIDFNPRSSTAYYKSFYDGKKAEEEEKSENSQVEIDKNSLKEDVDKQDDLTARATKNLIKTGLQETIDIENKDLANSKVTKTNDDASNIITPKPFLNFKLISTLVFIAALSFGFYFYEYHKKNKVYIPAETPEKCMHWTGNRYEPIACDDQASETPIIPIDFKKLNHFKKISNPDQLQKSDLGKIWYAKPNGVREYFTDSGMHPIDTNRALSPLTAYVMSNHISNERYLLHLLLWTMGSVVSLTLLIVLARKYL